MQELLDGIDQSKVDFQQLQDGTRRIVSKGISVGDFILAIPAHLVLFSDDFELSKEEGRVLSNDGKYEYGISTFKLMMHIIHLLQEEGCKKYYYLKSLPSSFNLPIEWADDKLELIRGTDLYKITLEKKKWLQDALKVAERRRNTNYKELLWAYSVISSRSFPKSRGQVCLWPVLDYLDHDPDSKIEWIITESEIKFRAMQDVEAGEILYNNYGPKGNENLLNNYGFVLEDNPNDYVKVTLNSTNVDFYEEKKQLLEEDKWLLFRDDDLPVGMIRACRILLCNQSEWSIFDNSGNTEISIRNEVASLMSLIGLLSSKLELYMASQEKVKYSKEQDLLIYINSHVDILEHHIQLCITKLESVACRADFFSLHHSDLDVEFLNLCLHKDLEELDNDTLLCLCLIHERENSARFSSRLLNLNVIVTDDQDEDNHFINFVLPHFESESINLNSLRWASCVLSSHGGYSADGSFGVWLPIKNIEVND